MLSLFKVYNNAFPLEVEREQTINDIKTGESLEIHLKGYSLKLVKTGERGNDKFNFPGFSLTQEGMVVHNLIQEQLTEEEAQKYVEFFTREYSGQYDVTLVKNKC